jgi:hypothetical protein
MTGRRLSSMDLFQRSRASARRVVEPLIEHAPLFTNARRVTCRPVCDAGGSLVFASIAEWEFGALDGESEGMHLGGDDPTEDNLVELLFKLLLDGLDGGVLVVWDAADLVTFLCRYATLPQVPLLLQHVESTVELLPIFRRLGRGGYSPSLASAALSIAGVPARSHLMVAEHIATSVVESHEHPFARDEPTNLARLAYANPAVWAEEWSATGDALAQSLLEEDGRLFVRRLQELDNWLQHEVLR